MSLMAISDPPSSMPVGLVWFGLSFDDFDLDIYLPVAVELGGHFWF